MFKNFFFQTFFLILAIPVNGQQLHGVVYFQNSGGKVAEGIEISALGCQQVYTNSNGMFNLSCFEKKVGQKINLVIGIKDSQGRNIEVVNNRQLEWLRLPYDASNELIEIIVCYSGERDKAATRFHAIFKQEIEKEYQECIVEINEKLKQISSLSTDRRVLVNQISELKKQRDNALQQIDDQSLFLSGINKDKASILVKRAIQKIEDGNDIEIALSILDSVELQKAYNLALNSREKAEMNIRQIIEAYNLKINLLIPKFRYREAIIYYEKIIAIYESNNFDKKEIAHWYNLFANVLFDTG